MAQFNAPLNSIRWFVVSNQSGMDIPAWALMQISGTSTAGGQSVINVVQPDGTAGSRFCFNGPRAIKSGGVGSGTFDLPVYVLCDTTASAGDLFGPKSGQWSLTKPGVGLISLGGSLTGPTRALFLIAPPGLTAIATLTSTLNQGSTATAVINTFTGGTVASSGVTVTVYDYLLLAGKSIASGTRIIIFQHLQSGLWIVQNAACPS